MNSVEDRFEPVDSDDDLEAVIPGTVFNKRQARILRNAVIVMGLMLVAGFALLIGIIGYRASQPATPLTPLAPTGVSVPEAGLATLDVGRQSSIAPLSAKARSIETMIPQGATYLGTTIDGNRLVVTLQTLDKNLQLLLIDLASWRIVGEAHLKQEPK